jgi:hypothetical protein
MLSVACLITIFTNVRRHICDDNLMSFSNLIKVHLAFLDKRWSDVSIIGFYVNIYLSTKFSIVENIEVWEIITHSLCQKPLTLVPSLIKICSGLWEIT